MTIPHADLISSQTAAICSFDEALHSFSMEEIIQVTVIISGTVQGFSFKPVIAKLANQRKIKGQIFNRDQGVVMQCSGKVCAIFDLLNKLIDETKTVGFISSIHCELTSIPLKSNSFSISSSTCHTNASPIAFGADKAICNDCKNDICENDSRQNYAFTSCANCGPRLSIAKINAIGSSNKHVQPFHMCDDCFINDLTPENGCDRLRPNTCDICGLKLVFVDNENRVLAKKDPITHAVHAINTGNIIGVKGIGGFQLVVNAFHAEAVNQLRQRKNSLHKPFALMVKDVHTAKKLATINEQERRLLESPEAPIVLLKKRALSESLTGVAPNQSHIGIMLPTSAVHHLLLTKTNMPLVVTSGNKFGDLQSCDNQKALNELYNIADFFLLHEGEINQRLDESVVQVINGKTNILTRARGYAPEPLTLPKGFENTLPVLAMGADNKNTVCFLTSKNAVITQHYGNLGNIKIIEDQVNSTNSYLQFLKFSPKIIAVDSNPHCKSRKLGDERLRQFDGGSYLEVVQHHHAHIASCMGENLHSRDAGKVIGIVLDGNGYADSVKDENVTSNTSTFDDSNRGNAEHKLWGAEVLIADYNTARNFAGLKAVPLLGGDVANGQPWRSAFAHLHQAIGYKKLVKEFSFLESVRRFQSKPIDTLLYMQNHAFNSPLSSSCGRLFDAVAYLIGAFESEQISYDGQAALLLESLVCNRSFSDLLPYDFAILETQGRLQLDPTPMWVEMLNDLANEVPKSMISQRFHSGLATSYSHVAAKLAKTHKIDKVALSGGVFANKRFSFELEHKLKEHGLKVMTHSVVPANNGGLSFGQALIAASRNLEHRLA